MTEEFIDDIHAMSHSVRLQIRRHAQYLRQQAAMWQPGPCPDEWGKHPPSTTIRHDYRRNKK